MKKNLITLLTAVAVTGSLYFAPTVLASSPVQNQSQDQTQVQSQIQSPAETTETPVLARESAQVQNRYGAEAGGSNFEDKDQDGVCDNLGEGTPIRKRDGSGSQSGSGTNFEDADKDGVCDNLGDGTPDRKMDGSGNPGGSKGKGRGK
ncbi:MAG: hypothetical protein QMB61_00450 [Clostridiaceae bacterium]